jgi:hypothetical protein
VLRSRGPTYGCSACCRSARASTTTTTAIRPRRDGAPRARSGLRGDPPARGAVSVRANAPVVMPLRPGRGLTAGEPRAMRNQLAFDQEHSRARGYFVATPCRRPPSPASRQIPPPAESRRVHGPVAG